MKLRNASLVLATTITALVGTGQGTASAQQPSNLALGDGVDQNDKPFRAQFPFTPLASPSLSGATSRPSGMSQALTGPRMNRGGIGAPAMRGSDGMLGKR